MEQLTKELTIKLIEEAGKSEEFKEGWGRSIEEYLDEYNYKAPQIWECVLADLDIEYGTPEDIDTGHTQYPVCPHCGERDLDWGDGLDIEVRDGSEWEGWCSNCDREYTISACMSIDFSTFKKEKADPEPEPEAETERPRPQSAVAMTMKEFETEGEKRFGKDKKKWKFRCPSCKTQQSFEDFQKFTHLKNDDIQGFLGFSCIGRYAEKKVGCDWSLGGLFQIHELVVTDENGKDHPHFMLAETK